MTGKIDTEIKKFMDDGLKLPKPFEETQKLLDAVAAELLVKETLKRRI